MNRLGRPQYKPVQPFVYIFEIINITAITINLAIKLKVIRCFFTFSLSKATFFFEAWQAAGRPDDFDFSLLSEDYIETLDWIEWACTLSPEELSFEYMQEIRDFTPYKK